MTRLLHAWRTARRAARIECSPATVKLRHLAARIARIETQHTTNFRRTNEND